MTRGARPAAPDLSALRGKRVLVALSGGADSVALAAMLAEAREALGLTLFAAHLDHGIRPESAADAEWCRSLCEKLGIPFHTARVDVPALAASAGKGLETAAREARYAWLRRLRGELNADCIALAHHMDDQAETVLMHLARGAGPEGIGGMAATSGDLVRPLLGLRKAELAAYLERRGLGWREDATNAVADTPRNALRLHGIPELEKSYPQFVPAAARYAEAARVESDFVAEQARAWLDAHRAEGPWGEWLRFDDPPHPALLRRAIRALCGSDVGWEKLRQVAALAEKARGVAEIPGGLRVERGRRGLYFLHEAPPAMRETPLALPGDAGSPERRAVEAGATEPNSVSNRPASRSPGDGGLVAVTELPGLCAIAARLTEQTPVWNDPARQVLDAAALRGAVVRTRRPGDRIRPLGGGDKLLSDYFTDRKVDRPLRDYIPLVCKGSRVLWACALGIAEEAKLTEETAEAVLLECVYPYDNPV